MAPHVRKEDVLEVFAARGIGPLEALEDGLRVSSLCLVGLYHGEPFTMFGITRIPFGAGVFGVVWLLGTDQIQTLSTPFLRLSEFYLKFIAKGCTLVGNFVDARNMVHKRWLLWLGFRKVATIEEFGEQKLPFEEFVLDMEPSSV